MISDESWPLLCPQCGADLGVLPLKVDVTKVDVAGDLDAVDEVIACPHCGSRYACNSDGVWDFLTPERAAFFNRFLAEYTAVRMAEGRGELESEDYRNYPYVPESHPLAWQWRIRAKSYEALRGKVLVPMAYAVNGRPLRLLDLGAGHGWLSYRLAANGHCPLAVDLSLDARDGLGAAKHFNAFLDVPFPRVRAEFDRLPLADSCADAVIFNASLHYSADYAVTLREALRVLARGGRIVIVDSPIYRHLASGRQMVAERKQGYVAKYGFASDALDSCEFLTENDRAAWSAEFGLSWQVITPWCGWQWALRPWRARLRRTREPARFALWVARVSA